MACDQAGGAVVTHPLVGVQMIACTVSVPEQRDKMTEPGCLFVPKKLWPVRRPPGLDDILSVCLLEWSGDDNWEEATFLLDIIW